MLDADEGGIEVAHPHTRTHVLQGQLLEPTPVAVRHVGEILARRGCRDQLADRTVEDHRQELVESVAQVDEKAQVDSQLRDRRERTHVGARHELLGHGQQARQFVGRQALGDLVRAQRGIPVGELGPVPGRVAGAVLELTQLGGSDHDLGGPGAVGGEPLDGGPRQPCRRRRRTGQKREPAQFGDTVQHRDPELRVDAGESTAVVQQHLAQAQEGVIHLADIGLASLLATTDRADDVATQRPWRDRESRKAHVGQPLRDRVQGCPPGTDHENALVLRDETSDGVDDRLGAAGSRQGLDDQRVARRDLGDHVLLLGVRVEKQRVGLRRSFVGGHSLHGRVGLGEHPFCRFIAGKRIEHRMRQVGSIGDERPCNLGERRDDQARAHPEVLEVRGEAAQPIDDGVGLEGAVIVGQGNECLGVEAQLELLVERLGERGIEVGRAAQLELEVAPVATDGQGTQQHGGAELLSPESPVGDTDAEVHAVDAARRRELETLGLDR